MKLYYVPGACSMACHIALKETGLPFEAIKVDGRAKKTSTGEDYWKINSKGQVPCLETQTGDILTEGAAILQYIADRVPEKDLAPRQGTFERYRLQEWLNFVATEVHKGMNALWNPKASEEVRKNTLENLGRKFDWLTAQMQGRSFLMGSTFTVADAYLYTILSWTKYHKIDMSKWPSLMSYCERVEARPSVREVQKVEFS